MYREQSKPTLPIDKVIEDLEERGSEYVFKKYRISGSQLSKIKTIKKHELIKQQESLQEEIFKLKNTGYTSVEIAQSLNLPLKVVNDLWNPLVFRSK